jgi:hypothetical protein
MGKQHKSYWFYFADRDKFEPIIRIRSKRMPAVTTIPWGGTWGLQEFSPINGEWVMPHPPEISWGRLKNMVFVKKELVT